MIPDQIPILSRGRHLDPHDGGCLMEVTSVLAGERWTDAPRCTHALLAAVARLVNDEVPDDRRHELLSLVPDLARARGDAVATSPAIVIVCAQAGLAVDPGAKGLRRALAGAAARLADPPRAGTWRDAVYMYGTATHTVVRTVDLLARRAPDPPSALIDLLRECVAVVRAQAGVVPLPAAEVAVNA